MTASSLPPKRRSPVQLLLIVALTIFVSEMLAMLLLPALHLPALIETFVDAALLIVLVFPVLYFAMFRPMMRQLDESGRAQEALRHRTNPALVLVGKGVS